MKKMRRIFGVILAIAMLVSIVPQVFAADENSASQKNTTSEKGTTELFSGHATYLLQERFHSPLSVDSEAGNYNAILSGWDVD